MLRVGGDNGDGGQLRRLPASDRQAITLAFIMFVHESALNLQSNDDRSVGARLAPDSVDKRQNSLYYDCDDGRKRRSTHKINIERH